MKRLLLSLGALAVAIATPGLTPTIATAFFTWGGDVSKDFAVGVKDGRETLYVVSKADENLTLWAFCPDTDCAGVPAGDLDVNDSAICPAPATCACKPPCKWRRETATESPSHERYGSPTVSDDGSRIVFGTHDGRIYGFDDLGDHVWTYDDSVVASGTLAQGFFARPAFHSWNGQEAFFAVNHGNNGQAHLHVIDAADGDPIFDPFPLEGSPHYFSPIVDDACAECIEDGPRVYVGAHDNDPDHPLKAVGITDDACDPGAPPCFVWDADIAITQTGGNKLVQLGGTIVRNVDLGASSPHDILVVNLDDGVLAVHLEDEPNPLGGAPLWRAGEHLWNAANQSAGTKLKETFRSLPTQSMTERDPAHPALYVESRGGTPCGEGRVFRLDPAIGLVSLAPPDHPLETPLFPVCETKIGNVSFVSPVVSPRSGHFFFGATNGGDPIYKVDPSHPQPSQETSGAETMLDYKTVGWFDYSPSKAWRSNPIFTQDAMTVHFGSTYGILYALDADEPCGVVRWCYDTKTREGGDCSAAGPGDGSCYRDGLGQVVPTGISCCDDLRDTTAPATNQCRRTAATCRTCWDDQEALIDCNETRVVLPTDEDCHVETGSEIDLLDVGYYDPAGDPFPASAVARGEWMNETTGKLGDLWCTIYGCLAFDVPLAPSTRNEIRVALWDHYGNESSDRLVVDAACP